MLILTNCLTEVVDEGCLKVATSLIKRLKKADSGTIVVTYDRKHSLSDEHLELNKLFLSNDLRKTITKHNDKVLYIPFPARTLFTALRIFILSLFCKKELCVAMVMKYHFNALAKLLLKLSGAKLVVFSNEAKQFYSGFVSDSRITYLKSGVDTNKFVPVTDDKQKELKKKYGFDENRPVILHVGHLNKGRGVDKLTRLSSSYQIVLVCSTLTKDEQDKALKSELLSKGNIRIIEEYLPDIQELYQLCDVYFFPTKEAGRCIDVPLSCLEAASCNKSVVATDYGELKEFKGKNGFYFINSMDEEPLNGLVETAIKNSNQDARASVYDYDWNNAVKNILKK